MKYRNRYVIRKVGFLLLLLLLPLLTATQATTAPCFGEYEIKAGFIYKFISFVSWPKGLPDDDTITIGILGKNPFGDAFKSVDGSTVGSSVVKIKFFSNDANYEELKACQILYISPSEEKKLKDILKAMDHSPTLTVGDSKDFVDKGGMLGFVGKENGRIGIAINSGAASKACLTIRSMLKRIAIRVIDGSDNTEEESRNNGK